MAREWQQTSQTDYVLPNAVYYQSLWAVRDLGRMEIRLDELKHESVRKEKSRSIVRENDVVGSIWQPTEEDAMERVVLEERVAAIYNALSIVPEVYKPFILNSIMNKKTSKTTTDKLWKIWKQRFLFTVAKNLSLI